MSITPQKIFFNTNLRFLRERRKMSQEHLAQALGMTRAKLAALELGNTKAPPPEDYLTIANFFKMSIDTLFKIDLTKIGELKLRELEAGHDVYMKGGNLRVLAISVDRSNQEHVEYVPVKAQAGYATGYHDPEFIKALPKYALPNVPKTGTFRIFPTVGDSMLPFPEGSEILARYVADWTSLKPDTLCIVVLKTEQNVVFKLLTTDLSAGKATLRSLNPLYIPYQVALEDIAEVWEYYAYTSQTIPQPSTDLDQVLQAIQRLEQSVKKEE